MYQDLEQITQGRKNILGKNICNLLQNIRLLKWGVYSFLVTLTVNVLTLFIAVKIFHVGRVTCLKSTLI